MRTSATSLDQLPSHGFPSGSRDLDATGQHTRSIHRESHPDGSTAAVGSHRDRPTRAELKHDDLAMVRIVDIFSPKNVRAKSEKIRNSG
jgi:hypothetical protein